MTYSFSNAVSNFFFNKFDVAELLDKTNQMLLISPTNVFNVLNHNS